MIIIIMIIIIIIMIIIIMIHIVSVIITHSFGSGIEYSYNDDL